MSRDQTPDEQPDTPAVGSVRFEVPPVTLKSRAYFSSYHLWAAQYFARSAEEIESEPVRKPRFDIKHRSNVTASVLSAIAFLEAAVNELFQDVVDLHDSYVSPIGEDSRKLMRTFWELTEERNRSPFSILDKYQMALTFCRKDPFSDGAQPYQDADLAIKLRNALMHYKPATYGGETQHKFFKQLPSKFSDNPLMASAGNPYFPTNASEAPARRGAAEQQRHSPTISFNGSAWSPTIRS